MSTNKKMFAFTRVNFILLAIGMAVVIIGFILMSGSGTTETEFNPAIFDARHIKIAPVVCLVGYVFMAFAIMYHRKEKNSGNEETENQ